MKTEREGEMRQRIAAPILCYLLVGIGLTVPAQLLGEAYPQDVPCEPSVTMRQAQEEESEETLRLLEFRRQRVRVANVPLGIWKNHAR
jgi:hypothetical protein